MKANRKFTNDEEAVSPVIGVILMVAITVILAAVIAAFVFGMGGSLKEAPPTVSFTASSNSASSVYDLIIAHSGGETLKGSDWKISVVIQGNTPEYNTSVAGDDFEVGGQLLVTTESGATSSITSWTLSGGAALTAQKYDVKMVHIPSNALVLDTVVDVR